MSTIYKHPEWYGLELIGSVHWNGDFFQYDMTTVWQRPDGTFLYGNDSDFGEDLEPFADSRVDTLAEVSSISAFQLMLERRRDAYRTAVPGDSFWNVKLPDNIDEQIMILVNAMIVSA